MQRLILGFFFFLAMPGLPRQDIMICGTTAEKWKEELHLHRQVLRKREASIKAGVHRAQRPGAARDIGNIVVLEDADGVVSRRNSFNLDRKTITFLPVTAIANRYRFQTGDNTYDPAAAASGSLLPLRDDDSGAVSMPFAFPFFGVSYQQVFVNSDGNLTFTAGDDSSTERSVGRMVAGPPRISALFRDLDPSRSAQGVRVLSESSRFAVSWVQVPEYADSGSGLPQTFQVRLFPDGRIELAYGGIQTAEAVVGIAPGGLRGSSSIVSFLAGSSAEYSAAVAERFTDTQEVDIATAAQKFYETHDDAYDYLVFYNSRDLNIAAESGAVAFEVTLRNSRSGYGRGPVDVGREFGSASRLQAIMNMGSLTQYPLDPNGRIPARPTTGDTPLTVLGHESGHLFLAYASVRDPSNSSARPMLGAQNAHWRFTFNSEASLLEGNRIGDNGPNADPRFTTVAATEAYAPLDQYLMGFRAPEEVAPTFLVANSALDFPVNRPPRVGVSFNGERRNVEVQELIQVEGRRTPDHTVSQRRFRFALVLIVPQGREPAATELQQLETYRTGFESFYARAASDRASADTSLRRSLQLSTFPAAGVIEGGSGSGSVSIASPAATSLSVVLRAKEGLVTVPASVTIPAGSTTAGFTIAGLRTGVDEISAEPADSRYDTAYSKLQVAPVSAVRLSAISGDKQNRSPGMPMRDPIVVRVSDLNNLPYPGARLRASASVGGSVTPDVAVSGANGTVSFRWTPGQGTNPQLRVFLDGTPESSGILVTGSEVIVVNAASYTPGLAPGAIGTIYGAYLPGVRPTTAILPWPETLAGVQVRLNDRPAALLYVSDTQINFLAPTDLPVGTVDLVISSPAGSSPRIQVAVTAVAPGIFFDPVTGFGAILNAGTAQTTFQRPAPRGGFVEIYCTGLGAQPGAAQVLIGPIAARVTYSGLTPGYLGLYQVNIQIPDSVTTGISTLAIVMNGIRSNDVRIATQ
jgi:uncharacterized protein (TIGR03437 family)